MENGSLGFTLVEILVVITIIGLLIAVSGGYYLKYVEQSEAVKTQALITELEQYASDYSDRKGDYPPSSLKALGIASIGDDANEGIEAFVQALFRKGYEGLRPDSTSNLMNADEDDADKNLSEFDRPGLFEIQDAWGNPLIYIRYTDYDKAFTYTFQEEEDLWEPIEVRAIKNPTTGNFYRFESCQILSVGPDGIFDTEDDVSNFDRSY